MNAIEYSRRIGVKNLNHIQLRPNYFQFDPILYSQANNIPPTIDPVHHYHNVGIISGLIFSPIQIQIYYPTVQFHIHDQRIKVTLNDKIYDIRDFCQQFFYEKTLPEMIALISSIDSSTIDPANHSDMVVLFQIGNNFPVALDMMEKLPNTRSYDIVFTYNTDLPTNILTYIRENYPRHMMIKTINMGSDIQPALIAYSMIKDIPYRTILKLHTKTIDKWRNEMIGPFMRNDLTEMITLLQSENNDIGIIGTKKWIRSTKDSFCHTTISGLYGRPTVTFIAGTIFMCRRHIWDSIWDRCMDTVIRNSVMTPFYYNNVIFRSNSPVHSLERIFGGETSALGFRILPLAT